MSASNPQFDFASVKARLAYNPSDDDANFNDLFHALYEIERLTELRETELNGYECMVEEVARLRKENEERLRRNRIIQEQNDSLRAALNAIATRSPSLNSAQIVARKALRTTSAQVATDLPADETPRCAECGFTREEHDNPNEFVP